MSPHWSSHIITALLAASALILLIAGVLGGYFKEDVVKATPVIPKKSPLKINMEEPSFKALKRMGRGVNILGYDGIWDSPSFNPFKPRYFSMIRAAGFDHVRINLHAFEFMDKAHRLAPRFFKKLDMILELAVTAGLVPIIDLHNVETCQKNPSLCAKRLKAFWQQVTIHYQSRYPNLIFELLNEPGGNMSRQIWNQMIVENLALIRAKSPNRTVIIAAINDGNPYSVQHLKLPKSDRNIIVTVHYYKPFNFTHQGASWAGLGTKINMLWGTAKQQRSIKEDFRIINDWAHAQHRPIYLGEFGVYEKASFPSSTNWLAFVTAEAQRLGWRWAYWQFDHDFKLFDTQKKRWKRRRLNAIMGKNSQK